MANFKTFDDIVLSYIKHLSMMQPSLDTKPGTVSRDVFIDTPAQQLAYLYSELNSISGLSSFFYSSGSDLNKLASNFGLSRAAGGNSTGVATFTTNNIDVDILIPRGTIVTSRSGINFETVSDIIMSAVNANVYRANATRFRLDLDLAGIQDEFAIQANVQSLTSGTSGNVSRFSIISTAVTGISNVTNLTSFSGGTNAESDDEFRTRVLGVFAGSNTGTELGYQTALDIVPNISDSKIVVPGDPLLVRDGTDVVVDAFGNSVVSDPGSGGKVDIYVLGKRTVSEVDSFIYSDQSGLNDPTDESNDFVLGQLGEDYTVNISQRRVDLADGLPLQPVDSIIAVSGSMSGDNFVEQYTDPDTGALRGNYILFGDPGNYGGSPFGFDKLKWTSNKIELEDESITKGTFNGTDSVGYSDINKISEATQDFLVTDENSLISASRDTIELNHKPVRSTSRVVNTTTGERYTISDQNPDGGEINTTGHVKISGSTLPVSTDILQVDYTWIKEFDPVFDFDNLEVYSDVRTAQDSIDWSFGNLVYQEPTTIDYSAGDGYTITVTHDIFKIMEAKSFSTEATTVSAGLVSVSQDISSVIDIRRDSDSAELYGTDTRDGNVSGSRTIVLPSDTLAEDGDSVSVRFNPETVLEFDGYDDGYFVDNKITLVTNGSLVEGESVLVSYISNVSTLIPQTDMINLPAIKSGNQFVTNTVIGGNQPTSNLLTGDDITTNLRRAGTNMSIKTENIVSNGTLSVSGKTMHSVRDVLVTVTTSTGYDINLSEAILGDLGVSSVSSNIKIMHLDSVEKVDIINGNIDSITNKYDIVNYKLKDNSYDLRIALEDTTLGNTVVRLPETNDNTENILRTGDIVLVSFHYMNTTNSEQLYYSKSGTQVTKNIFYDVSRIAVSSGFKNSSGAIIGNAFVENYIQPNNNTLYSIDYNYLAPKENERITVTFNHNAVINDASDAIEKVRPITADILIKAANIKNIDVRVKVVLLSEYLAQEQTVLEDAIAAVNSLLNTSSLGQTIDASDVINTLYTVSGIDRARIIMFGTSESGNTLSITADSNESLEAGTINIESEAR